MIAGALACLTLWIVRVFYTFSFATPYMAVTTGAEEESLFAIWKFTQHQPVYTDPHRIPFATSLFNWAYFYLYGSISQTCLALLHLDAIWIATIGRMVTIAFALATVAIFYLAWRDHLEDSPAHPLIRWAWCLLAACSPLVGFWSTTVRPDIGGLAFEGAGLYVVLRYLRKPNTRLIVLAAFLFYAAWAFKQTSVTMLTGSVVTLLLLKRWRAFLVLSSIWWFLVLVTLLSGSSAYRECLLLSQRHMALVPSIGLYYSSAAIARNPFILLGLVLVLINLRKRPPENSRNPSAVLLASVVLSSFVFALITSCKEGAFTNYFIPVGWAAMLALALKWGKMQSRLTLAAIAICSLWIVAIMPLHAPYGNIRYADSLHRAVARKLSSLPGPAIVTERYSNLPWVQRDAPHFVLGYNYYFDRQAGAAFEAGGWEAMARNGYFGTVVTDQDFQLPPDLLQRYKLADEYNDGRSDFKFYRRIGTESR